MTYRYVTQRDLDGTWSVREVATNSRAIYRGKILAGLAENVAAINARKLNDRSSSAEGAFVIDSGSLVSRIQEAIESPL
jgi:hypothetical protein